MSFPSLSGRDLVGRSRRAPGDLPRGRALALVGMRQEQQAAVAAGLAAP